MRARPLALTLAALAVPAAALAVPPLPRPMPPAHVAATAEALPAGALAVVTGDDLRGLWESLAATRLVQELAAIPEVRQGWDEAGLEAGLPAGDALLALIGARFAAGVYGELAAGRADLLLVADVEDAVAAGRVLEAMERRATADTIAFDDRPLAGSRARVGARADGAVVVAWTLDGDRLTLASGLDRLSDALALAAGRGESMAAIPAYAGALERIGDAPLRIWVDAEAIDRLERAGADSAAVAGLPGPAAALAPLVQLAPEEAVGAVAAGVRWSGAGLESDGVALLRDGARPELRRLLTAAPEAVDGWRVLPPGTLLHVGLAGLDPPALVAEARRLEVERQRAVLGVAGTADSLRGDSLVAARWEAWERAAGIDVEDELVPVLGSEIGLAVVGVVEGAFFLFPAPEILLAAGVADSARAHAVLTRLEAALGAAARDRGSFALGWESAEYAGHALRTAATPLGDAVAPTWSLAEGFALIGSRRAVVERAIDAGAGGPSLADDPAFAPLAGFYPEAASMVAYVDVEGVLGQVRSLLTTLAAMRPDAEGPGAATTDRVLAALQNATRAGAWAAPDGDALRWRSLLLIR